MLSFWKIKISAGFIFLSAFLYYLDEESNLLLFLFASALHEIGHYISIRAFGGKLESFELNIFGAVMKIDDSNPISYAGETVSALAGPAVNLLTAVTASFLGERGYNGMFLFTGINLIMALYNLIPAMPLDGGRALLFILCIFINPVIANKICKVISRIIAVIILIAGALILIYSELNFSLFACGCMMAGLAFWDNESVPQDGAHGVNLKRKQA